MQRPWNYYFFIFNSLSVIWCGLAAPLEKYGTYSAVMEYSPHEFYFHEANLIKNKITLSSCQNYSIIIITLTITFFLITQVVDKLGREGKQTVDFLDFLTYILLFIDIHDYILSDPLNGSRDR